MRRRDEEKVTNHFSSKQNQELVWEEREERKERVGGEGGGIKPPKTPLQLMKT